MHRWVKIMKGKYTAIAVLLILSLGIPVDAVAEDYFQIGLGNLNQDRSFKGLVWSGATSAPVDDTYNDSGTVISLGFARLDRQSYVTGNAYFPKTEGDEYYLFEISPRYRMTASIYAGAIVGYQIYTSTDAQTAQSIGASSSTIDLSGLTAGVNIGVLFFEGALDLNFAARFKNGNSGTLSGNFSGINYSVDAKVENTYQITLAYNFEIIDDYR